MAGMRPPMLVAAVSMLLCSCGVPVEPAAIRTAEDGWAACMAPSIPSTHFCVCPESSPTWCVASTSLQGTCAGACWPARPRSHRCQYARCRCTAFTDRTGLSICSTDTQTLTMSLALPSIASNAFELPVTAHFKWPALVASAARENMLPARSRYVPCQLRQPQPCRQTSKSWTGNLQNCDRYYNGENGGCVCVGGGGPEPVSMHPASSAPTCTCPRCKDTGAAVPTAAAARPQRPTDRWPRPAAVTAR